MPGWHRYGSGTGSVSPNCFTDTQQAWFTVGYSELLVIPGVRTQFRFQIVPHKDDDSSINLSVFNKPPFEIAFALLGKASIAFYQHISSFSIMTQSLANLDYSLTRRVSFEVALFAGRTPPLSLPQWCDDSALAVAGGNQTAVGPLVLLPAELASVEAMIDLLVGP